MNLIIEIVENYVKIFKDKQSLKLLELLNKKEKILLNAYKSNPELNERELSIKLYGDANPSNQSYLTLKKGLKNKLINIELLQVQGSKIQQIHKRLDQGLVTVQSLGRNHLRGAMVKLAKQYLKDAIKYQYYLVASELSRILSLHFRCYTTNSVMANLLKKQSLKYRELYFTECEAQDIAYTAIGLSLKNRTISKELARKTKALLENIDLTNDSHRMHFFYFTTKYIQLEFEGNVKGNIALCKEAIAFYNSLHFNHQETISIFRKRLISIYVSQPYNKEYLTEAKKIISLEIKKDKNPALLSIQKAWINSRLKKYDEALTELQAIKPVRIKTQILKDSWMIDTFAVQLISKDYDNINLRKIKINIKEARKDFCGLGLMFMIYECIYYIATGRAHRVEDNAGKIERYISNHLNTTIHARQINFLRLITRNPKVLDESKYKIAEDTEIVPLELFKDLLLEKVQA